MARRWIALLAAGLALSACTQSADHTQAGRAKTPDPAAIRHRIPGLAAVLAGLADHGRNPQDPPYYLSLGDSLSQGVQPSSTGTDVATTQGYPDQLTTLLRTSVPDLRLVKLGCSGETTTTMIRGGICHYPAGSQLAQATEFLRSHAGSVALITIDIGGNDPNSCVIGQAVSRIFGCLSSRIGQSVRNLGTILARLRAADGSKALIVGMNYYVPELGLWKTTTGRALAILTEGFAAGGNHMLADKYHSYGAKVADVFSAFKSADFGTRNKTAKADPPNVAAICAFTWMCAPHPRGPNEHANSAGYHVIAEAFYRAITK
ncbi:MAG TPA: SGNH/GDSL hydrolase family protein [Streptosporangiaceae bacterium]|nr:SGNH/GDSL hydrolase family protein [Streptosporangiaceae bacterium]